MADFQRQLEGAVGASGTVVRKFVGLRYLEGAINFLGDVFLNTLHIEECLVEIVAVVTARDVSMPGFIGTDRLSLIRQVDERMPTLSIVGEEVDIPDSSPFEADLVECPVSDDGVKVSMVSEPVKTGTGTGSMEVLGTYTGASEKVFRIQIDIAGDMGSATFKWSDNGGTDWDGTLIPIDCDEPIQIRDGLFVKFTDGSFVQNDRWDFTAEVWTEVFNEPNSKEFQINYASARIAFYSGDTGKTVKASYEGRGSVVQAKDVNQLIDHYESGQVVLRNLNTSGIPEGRSVRIGPDGNPWLATALDANKASIGAARISDRESGEVQLFGPLDGFIGLQFGKRYYLQEDGMIAVEEPEDGAVSQIIGVAISQTILFLNML